MPEPKDDQQTEQQKEFREGTLRIRFFEAKNQDGEKTTVFSLGRDEPGMEKLLSGGLEDLRRAKSLIIQAEKELSREVSKEWWPVVKVEKLIEGGARCRVEKSFPTHDEAELFAHGSPFEVFPRSSGVKMQSGEELVIREGDDKRIDRRIRQLQWREENKGEEFAFGRLHSRGQVPKVGDLVNIEALHDYQGEPRDLRITPLTRPVDMREPREALFLVIRRHPEIPNLGTVKELTRIRQDAIQSKNDRQAGHDARMEASNNRKWEEQAFSPRLRLDVPELRTDMPGRGADDNTPPSGAAAALPPPTRTIVVGSLRAEVLEMTDDAGKRQGTVKITRTKDGVEQHFEFDLGELLEVARQVNGIEKAKEDVKERLRDGLPEKDARDRPSAERDAKEEKGGERRNGEAEAERGGEEPPGPSRKTDKVRDNPHWVAGIWHGVVPPDKYTPLRYVQGAEHVRDRIMTPVDGEVRTPGPGDRPHFVIAKVVGDGLAIAHASTRNLNLIVPEVGRLQREAERRTRERAPEVEAMQSSRKRDRDRDR